MTGIPFMDDGSAMIQFGFLPGYSGFQPQLPAPGSDAATPQGHTETNPTRSAPSSAPYAPAAMFAPMTMMTPAYMMAYPQMGVAAGGAGYAGATAQSGPTAGGGHVTANPTNATTQEAGPAAGGFGGYGGVGMYGGFAMPVMMIAPVFFQMGYPMVFQGSQAQPPVEAPVADVPVDGVDMPVDDIDVPDPVAPPPVNTDPVVVDVVPEDAGDEVPTTILPIVELDGSEFAAYRSVQESVRQETNLSFELQTQDGDTITLDFSQIDSLDTSLLRGQTTDGDRVEDESYTEDMERVVNMDVVGDLDDAEKAAIDSVLSSVVSAVQSFFSGNTGDAIAQLKAMDFDSAELAELSLNMSMTQNASISKSYLGEAEGLQDLMSRDANVGQALEFIASEQRRLIDLAKDVLDAPSAAKLVRSLVPPMMSDPFADLSAQVAENGAVEAPVDEADDDREEEDA